jgi:Reverse transcriptase (RNA-dependent DNA polymerase)
MCVRGDLQTEGVDDVFDTYAPVASWSSIHMLTVLTLQKQWVTKQIDFSNAFVQALLNKDVYVTLPALFQVTSGINSKLLCLKLNKSLYEMCEAPKLWSDWLAKGLSKAGFSPSHEDPVIYYGRGMAIAVYVDDVLFFGPCKAEMEKVITELQTSGFNLKQEKICDDTAYNFLGINITEDNRMIKMTQHGLIKKFLNTIGMENCNAKSTPCSTTPLGSDVDGPIYEEEWEYASAVGKRMYLAGNAHPEIQFSVHQCARFTHSPCKSHTEAIKRIGKYLKGILDKEQGLMFKFTDQIVLDCYCDANFAGLCSYEDDQDPICVHSRTGYVMTMGNCPVHWTSKLQTEVTLSTTKAEYIALAQALRELLPLRRAFEGMIQAYDLEKMHPVTVKSQIFEDNNGAISTATTPKMTLRTKHIAVKYHFVKQYFGKHRLNDHPFELLKIDTLLQ